MKLRYKGKTKLVMFPDRNLWVTDGLEVVTEDKQAIKDFKAVGFKEVKAKKKEEGDN